MLPGFLRFIDGVCSANRRVGKAESSMLSLTNAGRSAYGGNGLQAQTQAPGTDAG